MARSHDSIDTEIDTLWTATHEVEDRLRAVEKIHDVLDSPLWKIALFVLDGWPLRRVVKQPQWRPWRRWWTS